MLKPTRDHVLIKVDKPKETVIQNGIVIKTKTVKRQTVGEVLAIGEGRLLNDGTKLKVSVVPGEHIIFYDYAGVVIEQDENPDAIYLLIKDNDVIATIET